MIILKVVLLSVFIGTLLYSNKKYVPYGSRVKREIVPKVFFPRGAPVSIETILARKEEIESRPDLSSRHSKRLHGLCECWECNDTCPYFREWQKCYKRDSVKKVASLRCMETCKNKDCEYHGGYVSNSTYNLQRSVSALEYERDMKLKDLEYKRVLASNT